MFRAVGSQNNLIEIPRELAGNIYYFLSKIELQKCQCVAKIWNQFLSLNFVWEGAFCREHPKLTFKITYWKEAFQIVPKIRNFFSSILAKEFGSHSHIKSDDNPLHEGFKCALLPQPIAYLEEYRFSITGSSHVRVEQEEILLRILPGKEGTCLSRLHVHQDKLFAVSWDGEVTQWRYLEQKEPYGRVHYSVSGITDDKNDLLKPISIEGIWELKGFLHLALCTGDEKYYIESIPLNAPQNSSLKLLTSYPKEMIEYQGFIYVLTSDTVDIWSPNDRLTDVSLRTSESPVKDETPHFLKRAQTLPPRFKCPLENQCFAIHDHFLCVGGSEKISIFNLETRTLIKTIPFKTAFKIVMHHDTIAYWNGTSVTLIKNWDKEKEELEFIELQDLLDKKQKRFPLHAWQTLMNRFSRKTSV